MCELCRQEVGSSAVQKFQNGSADFRFLEGGGCWRFDLNSSSEAAFSCHTTFSSATPGLLPVLNSPAFCSHVRI
jgi:hypothetical protein